MLTGYRSALVAAAACLALPLLSSPAQAVPIFARKYGFKCTMCHSSFPRLNDFGWRYRQNGYRLPGRENEEKLVYDLQAPVALRTSVGYNYERYTDTPESANLSQFQVNGLDILSAGLLGQNIGYMMIYPPEIKGGRGVAAQDGTLEMANVIFSDPKSTWYHLRAGRFEPAYVPFSVKRNLSSSGYEVYEAAFPGGPALADTQTGVEISGFGRSGLSYAAGLLNGSGTNNENDGPSDVYLRVAKVFGPGEGQTAGHRVGVTAYGGSARPDSSLASTARKGFSRLGLDASLNWGQWNLGLQLMAGRDSAALWGASGDVDFTGGFIEALFMPQTKVACFARADWVKMPSEFSSDIGKITLGARYHLEDSVALHFELSARKQGAGESGVPDMKLRTATCRVDFAF